MIKYLMFLILISISFSESDETIKVFIDCDQCDMDYIRTEIPYVNYVRDRNSADVHVLVTGQPTASNGYSIVIYNIGQNEFESKNDTISFIIDATATEEQMMVDGAKYISHGLFPYLTQKPIAKSLGISFSGESKEIIVQEKDDPWNNWVYSVYTHANLNGQQSYGNTDNFLNLSAKRITKDWKYKLSLMGGYNENRATWDDTEYLGITKWSNLNSYLIKSFGEHFSAGIWASAYSSTRENIEYNLSTTPKIEYNFFPYSKSSRQQLRLEYALSIDKVNYFEETIYGKFEDVLFSESIKITLEQVQPWGSMNISILGANYLHDYTKNNLSFNSRLSFRIIKGLSLNLSGSYSMVNNQIALLERELTDTEYMFNLKEQKSITTHSFSIGFSYTFGSIYNNIVNPRFGSNDWMN
jgi:hypothetical protein